MNRIRKFFQKEYSIPGGAGNVAMNLRSIGANVTCHGVVGNDIWGEKLLSLFSKIEIIKYEQDLFENISSGYDDLTKIFKHQMNTQSNLDYKDIWLKSNLKFEEKMMFADMNTFLQDDILCKVDRASMSCSLEVRTPFLHKHVLRESLKMPLEYKIKDKKFPIDLIVGGPPCQGFSGIGLRKNIQL